MNRILFSLTLILAVVSLSEAQSREKIKGNRNVTIKQTYVDDFKSLIIKNSFDVSIVYNNKSSVEIEADENLHDVIDFDVNNGVLEINTDKRIGSKKKLKITVNYSDSLSVIELYDDAKLNSITSMDLADISLKTSNNSRANLNIRASTFNFHSSGKSKSKLNVSADSTEFVLSDSSKLEALINSKKSAFDIYQRSDASIEGDCDTSTLRIDNSGKFSGKNFTIKEANLLIESSSTATIHPTELLNIEALGSSDTFIYGEPKINLNAFSGTAKLQKKDINAKGLF